MEYANTSLYGGQSIDLPDADLIFYRNWLSPGEAHSLLQELAASLAWEQSRIRLFGREQPIPRLNAWYGDPGCHYRYSGYAMPLHPWTPTLLALRQRLRRELGVDFNSLLANLYRDGNDSVGWHSDDEPELGCDPVIASLSLGATRRFRLRHKQREWPGTALELTSGSLLLMAGSTQHHWQHSIPKSRKATAERVNLTFRQVRHSDAV